MEIGYLLAWKLFVLALVDEVVLIRGQKANIKYLI